MEIFYIILSDVFSIKWNSTSDAKIIRFNDVGLMFKGKVKFSGPGYAKMLSINVIIH